MRFSTATAFLALLLAVSVPAHAAIVVIDFDSFSPGDGLAAINAVTTPLGVTFDASPFAGASIIDQGGGDHALRVERLPVSTTLVVNFASPADMVAADFEHESGPTNESSLMSFFNQPQSAASLNFGEYEYQVFDFTIPDTLASTWAVDYQPLPSRTRAALMSQSWGSGNLDTWWVLDNVVVDLVVIPLPASVVMLASAGCMLLFQNRRAITGRGTATR